MTRPPRESHDSRGFALLVVVGILSLLALLVTGFAAATRSQARIARNLAERARAEAIAEAGVAQAVVGLLAADPAMRWPADGRPRPLAFAGGRLVVRVQDEAGKIDLNRGPPEMIAALFAEFGIDPGDGAALVAAITARRAAVIGWTPPGAAASLAGSAPAWQATPVAFRTVEDLLQIAAGLRGAATRALPFLTVYAQSSRVNPYTAPRQVLLAIPGMSAGKVAALLDARAAATEPTIASAGLLTGFERYVESADLRAATIRADAATDRGARFVRHAVVALSGLPEAPYRYLEWRQDLTDGAGGAP